MLGPGGSNDGDGSATTLRYSRGKAYLPETSYNHIKFRSDILFTDIHTTRKKKKTIW